MTDNSNPKDGSTYLPVDMIVPGNSAPHNPIAMNPLRDAVSKPAPTH